MKNKRERSDELIKSFCYKKDYPFTPARHRGKVTVPFVAQDLQEISTYMYHRTVNLELVLQFEVERNFE